MAKVPAFGGAVLVALAMTGCVASPPATESAPDVTPAPQVTSGPMDSTLPPAASDFVDGEYSAEGEYGNLPSHIGVELTLDDGVIADVTVTPRATNPTSLDLQRRFAAAVPDVVVGRPIAELQVGRLAGSSGTPDGFNDALEQIRQQAQEQE